jgi:hypothetical protein
VRGYARFAVAIPSTFNEVIRRRDAVGRVIGDEWIEALLVSATTFLDGDSVSGGQVS